MDKELKKLLEDILFQLHVITSQNFMTASLMEGEDPISEKTREYGMTGLAQEQEWMGNFVKARDVTEWDSGSGS